MAKNFLKREKKRQILRLIFYFLICQKEKEKNEQQSRANEQLLFIFLIFEHCI